MNGSKLLSNLNIIVVQCIVVCLSLSSANINAHDRSSKMTNQSIGHLFSEKQVSSPSEYFLNRNKALNLIRTKNWQEAKVILMSLTDQYPDDGDTWYLLGLSYFKTEQWQNAVDAYKKTIAIGTVLSGIPDGSAPSNDIMIKIAQSYAELNQPIQAINWINKALDARYDGKHLLAKDEHFNKIHHLNEFKKAIGTFLPNNMTRDQSWQYDLNYLVSEIKRLHVNPFHNVSKQHFERMVTNIKNDIPKLNDKEIIFRFMELVALLGNGHNFIIPTFNEKGAFNQLPVQFYKFSDGIFIVNADNEYKSLIGHQLIEIAGVPIEDALTKVNRVNARDNEMQHLWLGPHYLALPEVLKGLGIVRNSSEVKLLLEKRDGTRVAITPTIRAMTFNGFPKLPALEGHDLVHNLKVDKQYWFTHLSHYSSVYMQYNYVHNDPTLSFKTFNKLLRKEISKKGVENLIIDLRHNAGGDGSKYPPLLKTIAQFEALKPKGKLFVIIGRNSFSAAHNLLVDIERISNAIIVGEPSGSRPNALSEAGWLKLPYSKTLGIVSSQYHQASKAEDHRIWIAPHVPVSLSSEHYFSGIDPALEAIFTIINQQI